MKELKLIKRKVLAEHLQISLPTLTELIKQEKIPFYRVKGTYRFLLEEVMDSLKEKEAEK